MARTEHAGSILERLKGLHPQVIDLSLDRIERLLEALGRPERHLPPVVHVAGTNGKGSTIAFLRAFLEAAGWRVHVYTSPHLVRFNERIRLAGRLIEDDALAAVLAECEAVNNGAPVTFFEVTTAAAFLAFARTPADVVLLETGLGGRLDATNVVAAPAVTAITRLSFDHRSYLGDTLTAIASEKAGILKPGVPAVIAPQPGAEALAALTLRAQAIGAPLSLGGRDWRVESRGDDSGDRDSGGGNPGHGFRFIGRQGVLDLPAPGLAGAHQIVNAGTALACLDHLPGLPVGAAAVARGLGAVDWPARLQRLDRGPLAACLPAGWELWLDGGHNDSAGEVLAVQAARWQAEDGRPLSLVFGMLANREPGEFLAPLVPHVRRLRAVTIQGEEGALSAADAAAAARAAGIIDAEPADDARAALGALVSAESGRVLPGRVLIAGSLYLAGQVLTQHGEIP